jgi:hypothetical protein
MKYSKGYKYQLEEEYSVQTPVKGVSIADPYFMLEPSGWLTIHRGWAWDGASGPTFDSKSSMTPSMVHDVFCVCMRDGRLSYDEWQDIVNDFFRDQCVQCGMWAWRAVLWHHGVEIGDAGNPEQGRDRKVYEAH